MKIRRRFLSGVDRSLKKRLSQNQKAIFFGLVKAALPLTLTTGLFLGFQNCSRTSNFSSQSRESSLAGLNHLKALANLTIASNFESYSVSHFGAVCDGVTDDSAAFLAADQAATADQAVVYLPVTTCFIAKPMTISRPLNFAFGGVLAVAANVTVILKSVPIAESAQSLFLGPGKIQIDVADADIYPEWFGAKSDRVAINNLPFQRSVDALTAGGTIHALAGDYLFDCSAADSVVIQGTAPVSIFGSGKQSTFIRPTSNCPNAILVINSSGTAGSVRDLAFMGDQLGVSDNRTFMWTAIRCEKCVGNDLSELKLSYLKRGLDLRSFVGSSISNDYIQEASDFCISIGGPASDGTFSANSGDTFNDTICTPASGAIGLILDSGVSDFTSNRFVEAGGGDLSTSNVMSLGGILIQNSTAGAKAPNNIHFFGANIDINQIYNMKITAGSNIDFHDSEFGQNYTGPDIWLAADPLNPTAKDNIVAFSISGSKVRAGNKDVILVQSGCNLSFSENEIYSAGGGGPSPEYNQHSAIHIQSGACGAVSIRNNMLGSYIYADDTSGSQYSILIESGAIVDYVGVRSQGNYPASLTILSNYMQGNMTGGLMDLSGLAAAKETISENLQ